jgi:ABC-type nitrate/sulfonate/bicarbonate transport system substrate-binding protein
MIEEAGGEGDFEMVTLGTSAYEALASGRVDFTLEVVTWEGVNAELTGRDQRAFVYADYGIPDQHTTLIGARADWLEANPETADAFLQATQRGYEFAAENPDQSAEILIDATEGLLSNPELIHASMQALVEGDYLLDDQGAAGVIQPDKVGAIGAFLYEAGILRNQDGEVLTEKPEFLTWFTNAFID